MKLAAHLSHYALYALMIGMPLIGWAMLSAAGYPVVLWGGVWLPPIAPQGEGLHTRSGSPTSRSAFLFFAVILLHVAAALFHALVRRDGVFEAMAGDLRPEAPDACPPAGRVEKVGVRPPSGRRAGVAFGYLSLPASEAILARGERR